MMEEILLNVTERDLYKVVPFFVAQLESLGRFKDIDHAEEFDSIIGTRVSNMMEEINSEMLFGRVMQTKEEKNISFTNALEIVLVDAGSRDAWYTSKVPGGKEYD